MHILYSTAKALSSFQRGLSICVYEAYVLGMYEIHENSQMTDVTVL